MIVVYSVFCSFFFFFKQKTAYEIPKRDWSSDVCSSDLICIPLRAHSSQRSAGYELSHQRPGNGFPIVVLSLEQLARRPTPYFGQSGQIEGSCRARKAGATYAGGHPIGSAGDELRISVAAFAKSEGREPGSFSVSRL